MFFWPISQPISDVTLKIACFAVSAESKSRDVLWHFEHNIATYWPSRRDPIGTAVDEFAPSRFGADTANTEARGHARPRSCY
ncbi:hypothetical protein CNECB9_2280004 [Cupriavidus necator]|uniref:Uncharacterized protein n=1 Tax=Cupriavidus necator TaxID=106590 RepID=A0A1K0J800_CUPNE|nr:hypothetical protein CNECB9_2280004 [Cupriavidus necator]